MHLKKSHKKFQPQYISKTTKKAKKLEVNTNHQLGTVKENLREFFQKVEARSKDI